MWPGPYGDRRLAQIPDRLARPEPRGAWGSTMWTSSTRTGRPRTAARGDDGRARPHASGRARRSMSASRPIRPNSTRKAAEILQGEGVQLLIHQPSYSMLNRWIEGGLLDTLEELGVGCIAFSPLAQGLLTGKYLNGVPERRPRRPGRLLQPRPAHGGEPRACAGLERHRAQARPDPGADGDRLGAARSEGHVGADRRAQCGAAGRLARCAQGRRASPRTSWPRSTATPPKATSTCGGRWRRWHERPQKRACISRSGRTAGGTSASAIYTLAKSVLPRFGGLIRTPPRCRADGARA